VDDRDLGEAVAEDDERAEEEEEWAEVAGLIRGHFSLLSVAGC
jgi:hypothetical protein